MLIERPKPIVDQVNEILRQRIRCREYPPGGRLPSESDLAAELGVSRATVRTVLATLAAENLIIRKQGDGTYVNKRVAGTHRQLGGIWNFNHIIENNGQTPSIQSLSTERRPATTQEATQLDLIAEDQVLSLVRLFLADNTPVILSTNVIPIRLIRKDSEPHKTRLSIHELLNHYCSQEIAYAISDIRATLVGAELVDILKREPGTPILLFNEVFYNENNQPLALGLNYYDDEALRLRVIQPWG